MEIRTSRLKESNSYSEFQRELSQKPPILPSSRTVASVACRTSSHRTQSDDLTSARSSRTPVRPFLSTPDRLLWDRTNENSTIPPLQFLAAASDSVQIVSGSYSSHSNWVYQKVVLRVDEKPGEHLRMGIEEKNERTVRQQFDALLPALLMSNFQTSLDIAWTDRVASLKRRVAPIIRSIGPTTINSLLSDLKVSIRKEMFGQVQSLVDGQITDRKIFWTRCKQKWNECYPCTLNHACVKNSPDTLWKTHWKRSRKNLIGQQWPAHSELLQLTWREQSVSRRKASWKRRRNSSP